MPLKTCAQCGNEKPLSDFEFRKDTQRYRATCKACRNAKLREAYPEQAERVQARGKKWREQNREQYLAHAREYAAANKERMNEASRKWAEANKETANARSIEWRKANRDRVREAAKLRHEAAPEKQRTITRNRRAKLKVSGEHSPADIARMHQEQNGKCNGCRCNLAESGYHVDHIRAVANGGSNGPENLQLLCPTCNTSKGTKDMHEWARSKGYA